MPLTKTSTTLACLLVVGFLFTAGCSGSDDDCPNGNCPDSSADAADTGADDADPVDMGAGDTDEGDAEPVDTGPKDTAEDDSGPDDVEQQDAARQACDPDTGATCELSCGGLTCDGATEACHVQPPGTDVGSRPDGDVAPGWPDSHSCREFPDACKSNPTCSCLEDETSRGFADCESGPNGITVTAFGI